MESVEIENGSEQEDSGLKTVLHYDKSQGTFKQIEGSSGLISIPHLPEPTLDKTIVLKVRGSMHTYYERFEAKGVLSQRTLEGRLRQETGFEPENVILLTDIPSADLDPSKHQIITPDDIMRDFRKSLSKKKDIARNIR